MKKLLIVLLIILSACESDSSIVGLWEVSKVTVGDNDVTPNARWMRFNADSTQESGNGWLQHSVGTWSYDNTADQLSMVNINGLREGEAPFEVSVSMDEMILKREEDGEQVEVLLLRTEKLPLTYGDQLFGLWQLQEVDGRGPYFDNNSVAEASSIFLRWDKRFVLRNGGHRINGVYNVHGHRPEIEFIPYGDFSRSFWRVSFEEYEITLNLLNSDSTVRRKFKRIYEFP